MCLGVSDRDKNRLNIKNAPIKLKLCTQEFFEMGNSMKLIIFDEVQIYPYLHAIFVILGPQKWVKIVIISKEVETLHAKVSWGSQFHGNDSIWWNWKIALFLGNCRNFRAWKWIKIETISKKVHSLGFFIYHIKILVMLINTSKSLP